MKLLVLDGNSIVNRAFYGIKLLSTKNGYYTNAIYGFLNILLKLQDMCSPDAVTIAFDVHAPTFRHKVYDAYKAGRHAMPDELRQQMPVLKNILHLLGYKTIECAGWEADDILGTLAEQCRKNGDECFIATGDRDSLQLAHGGVKVLLARTKMGQAVTDVYDEQAISEEYGITPQALIQVKALQGDASDNIPGVSGVGAKTALDLIQRFGTLDYIYENLDTIDIKNGVRNKLANDKDKAYLSLDLGTIRTDAPIDKTIENYVISGRDSGAVTAEFARLELFSMIDKFQLDKNDAVAEAEKPAKKRVITKKPVSSFAEISGEKIYVYPEITDGSVTALYFAQGDTVFEITADNDNFKSFTAEFFESDAEKYTYNSKHLHRLAARLGISCKNVCGDLMLSAYLLRPSDTNYDIDHLCLEYGVPVFEYQNELGQTEQTVTDCAVLEVLFDKTNALLEEADQLSLLNDIELPLARVLGKMEIAGVEVDREGIEQFGKKLSVRIKELTNDIYNQAGRDFNINSPKQLGVVLFEEMGIPCKKKTKSSYSTKAEVLEELAPDYPIVSSILEYRSLSKLKSTYCDGLLKVIEPDGRIHTSFNQVETRTGRISSLEPNL